MDRIKTMLQKALPGLEILENVSYKELTTLGAGSVLPLLAQPSDEAELSRLVKFLNKKGIPRFIFGGGSNIIGTDMAYTGVGIRLKSDAFSRMEIRDSRIVCGAFCTLGAVVRAAADAGLGGLSPLAGIPGTIGGAAAMNAGANGTEIGAFVAELHGIDAAGNPWCGKKEDLVWQYRKGALPSGVIATEVVLDLQNSDAETENAVIREMLENRKMREPRGRTAGCAFRNVSALESAGKLIDQCNLKGLRCGDMQISSEHANYMVNVGNASEANYLQLLIYIRRAVADRHGFFLELEQKCVNENFERSLKSAVPPVKVNVLCGGNTSEREVSLRSGAAVAQALRNGGFEVELTDLPECRITPSMKRCDVIYPVLHGGFGEGGELQALLERHNLRFTCSGSAASELVMDKIATKELLDAINIPTAKWKRITRDDCAFPEELGLPLILKVPKEGSTVGIIKIDRKEDWENALKEEFAMADTLLAEAFVHGVEISIPVIRGKAFDAIEIRSPNGFYDYDAKYVYNNGHTQYLCPPEGLPVEQVANARRLAEAFYFAAGCRDLVRVDFIVDKEGTPFVLEGNSLPGCTATSLVPKSARVGGISFEQLVSGIVYAAMKRPLAGSPAALAGSVSPLTRTLAKISLWLFRFTVLLSGLLLLSSGFVAVRSGMPGWPLIAAGAVVVLSEVVFNWIKSIGEK